MLAKPQNKTLAFNLKLLRTLKGETQNDLAIRMNSNQKNIAAYEAGLMRPKPEYLIAFAKMNGHTSTAMVVKIYDVKRKDRQHDRLKSIGNSFT